jgi:NAD(P)-dependent dehydrogenase (short-subunit alcohol dehydrogenase family)
MTDSKVVLVTGVSSGIGEAIAKRLVGDGHRVFGSVRSATGAVPDGVERVVLDVRDDASVAAAVASIGPIDAVVNNAGTSVVGAIEETEVAQAQALFDVNFFGAVRVTRAVLPGMRARRTGRLVYVSSVVGFLPAPFMGFYAASKHALEGYAESLDHEVRGLGIRATLIEPGYMKTKLDNNAARAALPLDDYAAIRTRVEAEIAAGVRSGDDPALVATIVATALAAPRPKARYQVGKGARTLAMLRSLMPRRMFDRALRKQFRLDAPS